MMLAGAASLAAPCAAAEVSDYVLSPIGRFATAQKADRPGPDFKHMFDPPARWPGVMRWRYNHDNAPAAFSANRSAAIQEIIAASQKWTAVCGVQIVYDGETASAPRMSNAAGSDGTSVVGWQTLNLGNWGAANSWYLSAGLTERTLVDSDIALDPRYLTTGAELGRIVAHEWGHAIGLAHSNVARALMSGPPDSAYNNLTDLTADDVNGCRCLYGPPDGQRAGYVCSLPEEIDFGTLEAGEAASQRDVTVTNSGNAALTISGIQTGTSEFFVGTSGCIPGTALAPGASCTFSLVARPAVPGQRNDEVTIDTSEGPFRTALRANGIAPTPSLAPNFGGVWSRAPAGSESGWGINFAHQGEVIFATWFTYDSAGKAWWLTMAARPTGHNAYAGTLYETRGPSFDAVPFSPSAVSYRSVGSATLTFSDSDHGTFAYTVNGTTQTKAIARVAFGPMPVCAFGAETNLASATNYQDVWWASGAGEAGWGVNFTHQGDTIFATWFTYDFDGAPMWLSVTAPKIASGTYRGTLYRTTGPPFDAVPFEPAKVGYTPVGTLTLSFADGNNATFAYTVTLGNPPVSVMQSKQLTRLVFRSPGTTCR